MLRKQTIGTRKPKKQIMPKQLREKSDRAKIRDGENFLPDFFTTQYFQHGELVLDRRGLDLDFVELKNSIEE